MRSFFSNFISRLNLRRSYWILHMQLETRLTEHTSLQILLQLAHVREWRGFPRQRVTPCSRQRMTSFRRFGLEGDVRPTRWYIRKTGCLECSDVVFTSYNAVMSLTMPSCPWEVSQRGPFSNCKIIIIISEFEYQNSAFERQHSSPSWNLLREYYYYDMRYQ